ncbi:uncharacterized protein ACN427_002419 [Glossina fuscipes fuscipes]
MADYVWYVREFGLAWAINTMTGKIGDDKNVRIETDSEKEVGFLRFNVEEKQVTQAGDRVAGGEEATDAQGTIEITEELTRVPCVVDSIDIQSPVNFIGDIYISEPSTSAQARLAREVERLQAQNAELKRRLARYEDQEVEPEADYVVPEIEALKEVVGKLTPHNRIVQLHFDEMCTNHEAVYSRAEDALCGCNYIDERTKKNVAAYKMVPVFAVRSLRTAFSMLVSVQSFRRGNFDVRLLEDNLKPRRLALTYKLSSATVVSPIRKLYTHYLLEFY